MFNTAILFRWILTQMPASIALPKKSKGVSELPDLAGGPVLNTSASSRRLLSMGEIGAGYSCTWRRGRRPKLDRTLKNLLQRLKRRALTCKVFWQALTSTTCRTWQQGRLAMMKTTTLHYKWLRMERKTRMILKGVRRWISSCKKLKKWLSCRVPKHNSSSSAR